MKKKVLGYYDYTVILTYSGMLVAFYGILSVISKDYWGALFCLMLAGVCDMFDGAVAATKVRTVSQKRFGIQIDSLSDLLSFGILPGLFVYMLSEQDALTGFICALFVLCALIRLAYFNVLEEERQSQTTEKRKIYMGVPVTTVALLLPLVYMVYEYKVFSHMACFPVFLVLLGIGFLSPIEIKKPGIVGKICMIIIGILETVGIFISRGWKTI